MKVSFLTDDRTNYPQGSYYLDWLQAFRSRHEVTVFDPSAEPPSGAVGPASTLVVIGHGALDYLLGSPTISRAERSSRKAWVNAIAARDCPAVFLSKNDYKNVPEKSEFAKAAFIDVVVSHSRAAVGAFAERGVVADWIPFGVDETRFRAYGRERPTVIGFRGNLNDAWNGGVRSRLITAVEESCRDLPRDIVTSQDGESFLAGDEYVDWLNHCQLVLNTVSAIGTVGPKWWEEMACGCIPVAPADEYEGLLIPDLHYLALTSECSDVRARIQEFMEDEVLRTRLHEGIRLMADEARMANRFDMLWHTLEERGLV